MNRPKLLPTQPIPFRDLPPERKRAALALKLHARRAASTRAALERIAPLELAALESGEAPPPAAAPLPDDRRFALCKRIARRALAGELPAPEGLRCHGLWAAPRWAKGLRLLAERDGLVFYGEA